MKKFGVVLLSLSLVCSSSVIANAESNADSEVKDFYNFVTALNLGIESRQKKAAELMAGMSGSESEQTLKDTYSKIAVAEWTQIESFDQLEYDENIMDLNQWYIIKAYVSGSKQQCDAINLSMGDSELFWKEWEEGYNQRSVALAELVDSYDYTATFGLSEDNTEKTAAAVTIEAVREKLGEAAVSIEDADVISMIQAIASTKVEDCIIDGKAGEGTKKALKKFQEENDLQLNGFINEYTLQNIVNELAVKNPAILEEAQSKLAEEQKAKFAELINNAKVSDIEEETEANELQIIQTKETETNEQQMLQSEETKTGAGAETETEVETEADTEIKLPVSP